MTCVIHASLKRLQKRIWQAQEPEQATRGRTSHSPRNRARHLPFGPPDLASLSLGQVVPCRPLQQVYRDLVWVHKISELTEFVNLGTAR